jgi:hypothetical protein
VGRLIASIAIIAIASLLLTPALAAELTAMRRGQHIGARVQKLDFPESLRKELVSGLTNRLLLRVSLRRDGQLLEETAIEITIRFDLWDESFHVATSSPGGEVRRVETSLDATLRALDDLLLADLFDVSSRPSNEQMHVHADVLLNPIDRERMDKIRRWVAENTTNAASSSQSTTRSSSASSELFARIFEQYAAGKDVASIWRRSLASRPFRLDELRNDAR